MLRYIVTCGPPEIAREVWAARCCMNRMSQMGRLRKEFDGEKCTRAALIIRRGITVWRELKTQCGEKCALKFKTSRKRPPRKGGKHGNRMEETPRIIIFCSAGPLVKILPHK